MQPNARMTFRFEPQPPAKRPHASRPEPAAPRPDAETPAGAPLEDDTYTLEQIIRRSEPAPELIPSQNRPHNTATIPANSETNIVPAVGEMTEWREDDARAGLNLPSGFSSRREGPSWWRVFFSVAGAVLTGALFGYMVLTLFTGQSPFSAKGGAAASDTPAQGYATLNGTPPATPSQATATASNAITPSAGDGAAIPAVTDYLLQFGVFRSEESMNAALAELKAKGLPSIADNFDGFRVYAGMAGTKSEAELLAGQLSGLAVYVKASDAEALRVPVPQGGPEAAAFIRQSEELAKVLSSLSVAALLDEQPRTIDPDAMTALRDTHSRWIKSAGAVDRLTGKSHDEAQVIVRTLNAAMASAEDYGRKISRFHLWNIQSDVTEAVLADRRLRALFQTDHPA